MRNYLKGLRKLLNQWVGMEGAVVVANQQTSDPGSH